MLELELPICELYIQIWSLERLLRMVCEPAFCLPTYHGSELPRFLQLLPTRPSNYGSTWMTFADSQTQGVRSI